ncbi:Ubiquitin carboxyl-terminal hydrolase 3 [Rhizophlyctis rosea]|nr:Ubiquitin carboxyl-terminal hydrolase 3 [Rhizophlyctis rosea]
MNILPGLPRAQPTSPVKVLGDLHRRNSHPQTSTQPSTEVAEDAGVKMVTKAAVANRGGVRGGDAPVLKRRNGKAEHITGLTNLGSTCYMNVVLQTLCHTPPFQPHYLDQTPPPIVNLPTAPDTTPEVWDSLRQLLRVIWETKDEEVTPRAFWDTFARFLPSNWMLNSQQDAQEFLHFLLERLNTERNEITDLFKGEKCEAKTCQSCGHVSETSEAFMDVSLPIPERFAEVKNKAEQYANPCTINHCLDKYTAVEKMDDLIHCDRCNFKQPSTKRSMFDKLPEVLCLHIMRQKPGPAQKAASVRNTTSRSSKPVSKPAAAPVPRTTTTRSWGGQKIETYIHFPVDNFDMAAYVKDPSLGETVFNLYAAVIHEGDVSSLGHFYVVIWSEAHDSWLKFSDDQWETITVDAFLKEKAYLLFYLKNGRQGNGLPFPTPPATSEIITPHGKMTTGVKRKAEDESRRADDGEGVRDDRVKRSKVEPDVKRSEKRKRGGREGGEEEEEQVPSKRVKGKQGSKGGKRGGKKGGMEEDGDEDWGPSSGASRRKRKGASDEMVQKTGVEEHGPLPRWILCLKNGTVRMKELTPTPSDSGLSGMDSSASSDVESVGRMRSADVGRVASSVSSESVSTTVTSPQVTFGQSILPLPGAASSQSSFVPLPPTLSDLINGPDVSAQPSDTPKQHVPLAKPKRPIDEDDPSVHSQAYLDASAPDPKRQDHI